MTNGSTAEAGKRSSYYSCKTPGNSKAAVTKAAAHGDSCSDAAVPAASSGDTGVDQHAAIKPAVADTAANTALNKIADSFEPATADSCEATSAEAKLFSSDATLDLPFSRDRFNETPFRPKTFLDKFLTYILYIIDTFSVFLSAKDTMLASNGTKKHLNICNMALAMWSTNVGSGIVST
jgi:hypothetical protein